jgi:hypothetical protein
LYFLAYLLGGEQHLTSLYPCLPQSTQALEALASSHTTATDASSAAVDSQTTLFDQALRNNIWGVEAIAMPSLSEASPVRPRSWTAGVGGFGRLQAFPGMMGHLQQLGSEDVGNLFGGLSGPLSAPAASSLGERAILTCNSSNVALA